MSTLFLSKPNEILAGVESSGLTKHDDVLADHIKDTWWRAHNMDKIKAREKKVQQIEDRSGGPFTAICDWMMVVGEIVRDKASWRKATIISVNNEKRTRRIKYEDNGGEIEMEVYQLEIFAQNNDLALVFRDWFQTRVGRQIGLPPIRPNGEEVLCSILNNIWEEQCEISPARILSPLETAFITQRLINGTIDVTLKNIGINLDQQNATCQKQFAFEIAGHSQLPRILSHLIASHHGDQNNNSERKHKTKNFKNDSNVEEDEEQEDETQSWGLTNLYCIPLWWDSNSENLRNIQALLRYHYHPQYSHWAGTNFLEKQVNAGGCLKEADEAAVVYLIHCDRVGPPEMRSIHDRINKLKFDVKLNVMKNLLHSMELVNQPIDASLHIHSLGFSWPQHNENDKNNNNSDDADENGEKNLNGYYRHHPRDPPTSHSASKRENILRSCCVETPTLRWQRELNFEKKNQMIETNSSHSQQVQLIQRGGCEHQQIDDNIEHQAQHSHYDKMFDEEERRDEGIFSQNSTSSAYWNQSTTSVGGGSSGHRSSVRGSLHQSRELELDLNEERKIEHSLAMVEHNENSSFLMSCNSSLGEVNDEYGSEVSYHRRGGQAAQERREADKYSVVLKNTTQSLANASLWSDEFKEATSRPLNHHILTEQPTVLHHSLQNHKEEGVDGARVVQSVRPRTVTPRSRGRGSPNSSFNRRTQMLDTPGQQARQALAASKAKVPRYKTKKKEHEDSIDKLNSNLFTQKGDRLSTTTQKNKKKQSSLEAEASGNRLTYQPIAAKWAGPIAGKERGYGIYEVKSTTRRVVSGDLPTEDHGTWKLPDYNKKEDKEFHAPPPPRPPWQTKALRLANAYDVPEKPSPYPIYKLGEKVRAKSNDQPNAWFDAHVINVIESISGHPAETKYDVRYDGYKNQPSRSALGRNLSVEMIKGASSMKQVDR